MHRTKFKWLAIGVALIFFFLTGMFETGRANDSASFRAIAFFTGKNDRAHISFVKEANNWFFRLASRHGFSYDTTSDWNNMNDLKLKNYQLVIFFDTRPDISAQRLAFEKYVKNGGGFIGFHFAGFALTPSDFPQNWDWYHESFLGSGQYRSNTWRPTAVVLKVEKHHAVTKNLPETFQSSPSEWYRWSNDLRNNPDIDILLSIDSSSFPVGTGPKPEEIWHSGYYPVAWTNKKYRMVYFNMGHNDIDYESGSDKELSFTFGNKYQDQLIENAVLFYGKKNPADRSAGLRHKSNY
ncbi:MAG: ThuA domain-containing protein [Chitinophagaceae bacterium]|nr:MAG: ThuA domain-containing protein [Chitinophagaceae bacterium]